jgi:tight adherence protein B
VGEVANGILLAVVAGMLLLGAALFWVLRTERRRETVQQRLQAITTVAPSGEVPGASLRRPLQQGGFRAFFFLPAGLRARLDAAFAATGNRIGVPHLALTGAIAAAVVVLFATRLLGLNSALAGVLAAAAAVAAPALLLRLAQSRYQRRFLDVFPDALDLVGRAVKAGLPVVDAMEVAAHEIRAPVGGEFQRTLDEMRLGVEIEDALEHTARRIRVPDFQFYVSAIALQRRTGGSLAETLANLSNIIRRRKELRQKVRALTAESKAAAGVLAILPFLVGAVLYLLNRDLMSVLFVDPRGRFMVGLALLSLATGIAVMAVIIRKSLR